MSTQVKLLLKWAIALVLALVFITGATYLFRNRILTHAVTYFIEQDSLQTADALFVLSGGGYDRGNEAAEIFNAGYTSKIICTGGNPVVELRIFNMDTLESDMTVANLRRLQIPDSCITQIRYGTSTREEADTIINFCIANGFKKVMVLSSLIHTHRVNNVFREQLKEKGISLIVRGASSSRFDELHWWQSEDGLIAINNEWIKTIYYWWKY